MAYDKKALRLAAYLDLAEHISGHRPVLGKDAQNFPTLDGKLLINREVLTKLAEMRSCVSAQTKPAELRYVGGGIWHGPAPIPGMHYACERDDDGAWWILHGPYPDGAAAEAAALRLGYGAAGGPVVVYSEAARGAADRGERPIA